MDTLEFEPSAFAVLLGPVRLNFVQDGPMANVVSMAFAARLVASTGEVVLVDMMLGSKTNVSFPAAIDLSRCVIFCLRVAFF